MVTTTLSTELEIEGDVATLSPSRGSRRLATIALIGVSAWAFLIGIWLLMSRPMRMAEGPEWFDTTVGTFAILFGSSLVLLNLLGLTKVVWTIDRAAHLVALNGRRKLGIEDVVAIIVRRDDAGGEARPQWSVGLRTTAGKPLRLSYEQDVADAERLSSALASFLTVPSESE